MSALGVTADASTGILKLSSASKSVTSYVVRLSTGATESVAGNVKGSIVSVRLLTWCKKYSIPDLIIALKCNIEESKCQLEIFEIE